MIHPPPACTQPTTQRSAQDLAELEEEKGIIPKGRQKYQFKKGHGRLLSLPKQECKDAYRVERHAE